MRWLMLVGIADEVLEGVILPELLVAMGIQSKDPSTAGVVVHV